MLIELKRRRSATRSLVIDQGAGGGEVNQQCDEIKRIPPCVEELDRWSEV